MFFDNYKIPYIQARTRSGAISTCVTERPVVPGSVSLTYVVLSEERRAYQKVRTIRKYDAEPKKKCLLCFLFGQEA
jgi:hypothetical protein